MTEYEDLIADLLSQYTELVTAGAGHDHRVGVPCPGCRRIDLSRRLYEMESAKDDVKAVKRPGERNPISRRDMFHRDVNAWHGRKKAETDELIVAIKERRA